MTSLRVLSVWFLLATGVAHATSTPEIIAQDPDESVALGDVMMLSTLATGPVLAGDGLQLRAKALRETAVTVGIQSAIRFRYGKINKEIEAMATQLDGIYDFRPLLVEAKMLPPIIAEAEGNYGVKEDGSASSSLLAFEIIQDAKLVAAPPQWRDYLIHEFEAHTEVSAALKPKDDTETAIWQRGVAEGWEEGIKIADRMAIENINRLTRDYRGAVRFHRLAQQGVVSMPTLAIGDMAIHVNGKKLDVNQRIFRITEAARYQENTADWKIISGQQVESKTVELNSR